VTFLAPALLALAVAAAVPLVLHLLRRRLGRRVEFPAARYLLRAERENSRRLRLRNLVLMVLRVAAVLLIAAAAARPVGRIGGTGHAPTAVAIVLDNTLSSSVVAEGRTVLDRLKDAARAAVGRATAGDRMWLVTADGVVTGATPSALLAAIDRVEPVAGGADLAAAMRLAAGVVGAGALAEHRLAVLSDGQPASWNDVLDVGPDLPVLLYVPRVTLPANRGVRDVVARPERWTPEGDVVARVASADSASYRIELAGRTLARGTAPPGDEIRVRAAPPERGWVDGAIELQPDELRGDDARFFAVWLGAAPGVHVDPSAGAFAENAVAALRDAGRVATGTDIEVTSADALTRLPALIVAPSDPVRIGAANRALERVGVPWRFGIARRGAAPIRFAATELSHTTTEVMASSRYVLERRTAAAADTLARAGAEPWIVAGDGYVMIASPVDPAATTFPVRAAFVPWVASMLSVRLGAGGGVLVAAAPRTMVPRPRGADELQLPDGQRITLTAARVAAPARPGVSFFLRSGQRIGALVVNPDTAESDLARLADEDLAGRVRGRTTAVFAESAAWTSALFGQAARRPLTIVCLLVALGALAAESAMTRSGAGRHAA
jgi:hypothetical protein